MKMEGERKGCVVLCADGGRFSLGLDADEPFCFCLYGWLGVVG